MLQADWAFLIEKETPIQKQIVEFIHHQDSWTLHCYDQKTGFLVGAITFNFPCFARFSKDPSFSFEEINAVKVNQLLVL